ncbi:MAG: hypothetical protein HN712_28045 [Gemmatimonadetes bacterium]|jgi:hypothetical protein|nr:hypothetical protein [Gemmatimonadota bacterium]MBT7864195.1 hypothetical protein [Gemmatimonadota bacterium]
MLQRGFTKADIERAARMYHQATDASRALGITPRSFSRLCRKFGIETPSSRKQRRRADSVHSA